MTSLDKIARDLERVERTLRAVATQPRLAHSSIDGGALQLKDVYGNIAGYVGQQYDGTITSAAVGGTTPTPPTAVLLEPIVGGLRIYWDGTYIDGSATRMDFRRVTFHAVTDVDDLDVLNPAQIVGEITIATGGEVTVSLPAVEYFVFAVTWTEAGKFSVESDVAFATPLAVVDPEMWQDLQDALTELNDVSLPALHDALAERVRVIFDPVQPTGLGADDRVVWYDPTNGNAASYWDGTAWGPYELGSGALAASSILAEHLGVDSVTADAILAGTITAEEIAADTITANEMAADSVTANELAANSVNTEHLIAGSVDAATLNATALNGKVITGALIRSAASGRRVEMSTSGFVQYDTDGSTLISIGDQNKFVGSIDALNMIIRDGLELFGKNNSVKTGAELVLSTGQGGSTQQAGLTSFYEVSPTNVATAYEVTHGAFTDSTEGTVYRGTNFFGNSALYKGGTRWPFPSVLRSDGSSTSSFSLASYTRIKNAAGERVITIGHAAVAGEVPGNLDQDLDLRVYNDAAMTASVVPTRLPGPASFTYAPGFSFSRTVALGKLWGADWDDQFCLGELMNFGDSTSYLRVQVHHIPNDTTRNMTVNQTLPLPVVSGERLAGISYGLLGAMKFVPVGHANFNTPVWVIQTTHKNVIWVASDYTATGRRTQFEWPITPTAQHTAFACGDIDSTEFGFSHFANLNGGASFDEASTERITRYSNASWDGSENPIWAQFAWKGHSSQVAPEWLTSPSPMSVSASRVKRAKTLITVPSLPTPTGGVGAARDTAKDIYSWRYYVGRKATTPARTEMWLQSNTPTGEPTAVTSLVLPDTLVTSGTNPLVATTGFTTMTPAKIVSSAGDGGGAFLTIDGNGNIDGKDATFDTLAINGNTYRHDQSTLTNGAAVTSGSGRVYRRGGMATAVFNLTGNFAANATIGTAISGYRPPERFDFWGTDINSGASKGFYIDSGGAIHILAATNSQVLGTVTFPCVP